MFSLVLFPLIIKMDLVMEADLRFVFQFRLNMFGKAQILPAY